MAQQNLHSSQTLLHLLNTVSYSFLVTMVTVKWFFSSENPFMHSQVSGTTEKNDFTSWLDSTSDWINDLHIVYIHASEQQILIRMRTTKTLRNLRIFCSLLGTVHYWGLLLNKNGWEAGFCPLLGAFPLLGSALLGEYSVLPWFLQIY